MSDEVTAEQVIEAARKYWGMPHTIDVEIHSRYGHSTEYALRVSLLDFHRAYFGKSLSDLIEKIPEPPHAT